MDRVGVRCNKCQQDVWASPLAPQKCNCGAVEVFMKHGKMILGRRTGANCVLLKEEGGKVKTFNAMDLNRAPGEKFNEVKRGN